MNEILAPIYYVFRNDSTNPLFVENVESEAFVCFTKVMGDGIKDSFAKDLDNNDTGIITRIGVLGNMLKDFDFELW